MKIGVYSFYNISVSELCNTTGGTNYGNHLYYPFNILAKKLQYNNINFVPLNENIDIALFLDLNEYLFNIALKLPRSIKKILICAESPIYCPFVHHVNILNNDIWDIILTYNRSFKNNKIKFYDIPITGNINNVPFQKSIKNNLGVVVSSLKNDSRGFVPKRRDELIKKLAIFNEIEVYGHGWVNSKNIFGATSNKIKTMKNHSFALVVENCKCDGYVTEKLGDAILAGLPSIYYGDYKNANRRFPGTFVELKNLDYNSFLKSKSELFNKYDTILQNVEKSFLNSYSWSDSFINNLYDLIIK